MWNEANVEHISRHGVMPREAEYVVTNMNTTSKGKARPAGKQARSWSEMTADELEAATKGFENIQLRDTRPMTTEERAVWERTRRGRGRPRSGEGAVRVLVTLERRLKLEADAFAKEKGMGRSELIARALRQMIGSASPGAR
jgi:hypothetical protein